MIIPYNIIRIARLCKGSTSDSDSLCEGSNPSLAATSERTLLRSDFCLHKNQSHAPSFLLSPKRSRLLRLCPCKRGHNVSSALPTFWKPSSCLMNWEISKLFTLATSKQSSLCYVFLYKKTSVRYLAPPLLQMTTFVSADAL